MKLSSLNTHTGFSLVEVIIASAVMLIVGMGFTTMINRQQVELKFMAQKFIILDIENILLRSLGDGKVCTHLLKNPARILTGDLPPPIDLNDGIPAEVPTLANPNPSKLVKKGILYNTNEQDSLISSIQINDITKVSANSYTGNLEVKLDDNKTVRALRPARLKLRIYTNILGTITNCLRNPNTVPFQIYNLNVGDTVGPHTYCALQKVQNMFPTTGTPESISVVEDTNGYWTLDGNSDPGRSGIICIDF